MTLPGRIEVEVAVVVGSAELPLQRLLNLSRGAVIALGRDAEEPLKVLANGVYIADARVALDGERVNAALTSPVGPG
jgi:flagellar motor switch protein FliN/FliY